MYCWDGATVSVGFFRTVEKEGGMLRGEPEN